MIPLGRPGSHACGAVISWYSFAAAHGSFVGRDLEDARAKPRLLGSTPLHVRAMGHTSHPLLSVKEG